MRYVAVVISFLLLSLRRLMLLENVKALLSQSGGCRDTFNFIEKDCMRAISIEFFVYVLRFPGITKERAATQLGQPALVAGWPPCQGLSMSVNRFVHLLSLGS